MAAPWNGSTAEGWLWLSTLNATATPLTEVEHAGVLARALQHAVALARQTAEQRRRVLVAAVLRPEEREDGELEVVRLALEQSDDTVELLVGEAERAVDGLSDGGAQSVIVPAHPVAPVRRQPAPG